MSLFLVLTLFFLLCFSSIIDELRIKRLWHARKKAEKAVDLTAMTIAILSHEIRNPLTGFLSIIRLLRDTSLNDNQKQLLQAMDHSSQELLSLLDSTLTQAHIEKNRLEIIHEKFSPEELANSLFVLLNPRAKNKGVVFTTQIDQAIPAFVVGDAAKIRQIVLNLLSNAIKFTSSGIIKLHISASDNPNYNHPENITVCFNVIDSGMGMSEQTMRNIFSPFSQGQDIQRHFGGTGLGLSISRNLAHAMGGDITLCSQEGVGSTFTLLLPLLAASHKPLEEVTHLQLTASSPPNLHTVTTRQLRLLVIDDTEIHLIAGSCLLESLGHHVTLASSATEAIRLLEWQSFDCVFIDIHMPGIDGISTMQHIRQMPLKDRPQPAIVILSAWLPPEVIAHLLDQGADAACSKPLDLSCVSQILANLTDRKQTLGEKLTPALSPQYNSRIS